MGGSLMALDSASMYFRTFYGVPESVTAPDGTPVNAVRGFLDAVARLVMEYRPTRLVAAFDADWRPAWRVDALPSYKAHRVADEGPGAGATSVEAVPDLLSPQVPVIEQVLDAVGVARVGVDGFEADDVLASIAEEADVPVDVVTGDRDLFQLVDDGRRVRVLYTGKGFAKLDVVDAAFVRARYGVEPEQYADLALLRGDPSDGLPGVAGVGEKTAAGLLSRFGSLEALLAAVDDPTADVPRRPALEAARGYIEAARVVVPVRRDVALPSYDDALPVVARDAGRLDALAARWGLRSSVDRLLAALPG